jgi:hypothetical protein
MQRAHMYVHSSCIRMNQGIITVLLFIHKRLTVKLFLTFTKRLEREHKQFFQFCLGPIFLWRPEMDSATL